MGAYRDEAGGDGGGAPAADFRPQVRFAVVANAAAVNAAAFAAAAVRGPVKLQWADDQHIAAAYPAAEEAPFVFVEGVLEAVDEGAASIQIAGVAHDWVLTGQLPASPQGGGLVAPTFAEDQT